MAGHAFNLWLLLLPPLLLLLLLEGMLPIATVSAVC